MNEENESQILDFKERNVEEKVKDFSGLLDQIESLSDKKRQLWKEIYENAIIDRQHSYVMFVKLINIMKDNSTEHAIHGRTVATYIEKMSKANDQLIKLAELIAKADRSSEEIDPDEMFKRINGGR